MIGKIILSGSGTMENAGNIRRSEEI